MHLRTTMICFSLFLFYSLQAQDLPINPSLLKGKWSAKWIACPDAPQRDYGVYHFRKNLELDKTPEKFIVHVSADNRYRLFVNGVPVSKGPARGDLYNWYFESVDIAEHLRAGTNVVAALVWNMGVHAPVAQVSNQTGLVVQGDTEAEHLINTNTSWKVFHNKAYKPCSMDNGKRLKTYMVIGPGDEVDASQYPWDWEKREYDDGGWQQASLLSDPVPFGFGTDNLWTLKPRNIPALEERQQRIPAVRRAYGVGVDSGFLTGTGQPLSIPPNRTVSILLDQTYNTVAYPELLVSGGADSRITLTYAEALFDEQGSKRHRDQIDGMQIIGNYDTFLPDGGANRLFRPLWLRTYRYLQLDITTANEPLKIHDLYGMYATYPFKEQAVFESNDASLQDIWDVGWRTARLCAGESYYDCPYYEQLQYSGDSRIQALISFYVTGDDRLARKSILDFYHSMVPEGLVQGRYPSNRLQVIPPYSLWWVSMVYDYWMHRSDQAFAEQFLTGISNILDWYERHIDSKAGMLGPMPWWNFVDWATDFQNGVPDGATDGHSAIITLQYIYALQQAEKLFEHYGKVDRARHCRELIALLRTNTYQQCYDRGRGLLANTPELTKFSQHANILGVLTHTIPVGNHGEIMNKVLDDHTLTQATFYFRFYLNQALKEAAMADLYYGQLTPWRDMLDMGLTTFPENPEPTRSDCHAWSASPNYDFFATICGIVPAAPGFAAVEIKPALGELKSVSGTIPHPAGEIKVDLERIGENGLQAKLFLPSALTGRLIWKGESYELTGGRQVLKID